MGYNFWQPLLTKYGRGHGIDLALQSRQFFCHRFKSRFSSLRPLHQSGLLGVPVGPLKLKPFFKLLHGGQGGFQLLLGFGGFCLLGFKICSKISNLRDLLIFFTLQQKESMLISFQSPKHITSYTLGTWGLMRIIFYAGT